MNIRVLERFSLSDPVLSVPSCGKYLKNLENSVLYFYDENKELWAREK